MLVTPTESTLWVAYFAPFTYQDHQALIARVQHARGLNNEPMATVSTVAQSLDGRDVELITLGNGPAKVWMIARQHPGESMAEHYMEGMSVVLLYLQGLAAVGSKLLSHAA
jgi:murein tripeptide amidase MpaA